MFNTTPSGNNGRRPGGSTDPATAMHDQFNRLFGPNAFTPRPETVKRMDDEAQELLALVSGTSSPTAEETALLASPNDPFITFMNSGKRDVAEHALWIKRVTSGYDEPPFRSEWVKDKVLFKYLQKILTDVQFDNFTALMHEYPTLHVSSQLYIRECLRTFASKKVDDLGVLYKLLMLGKVIYPVLEAETASEAFRLTHFIKEGKQLIRGTDAYFDDGGDMDDPQVFAICAALLKFAFCLQVTDKHPNFGMKWVRPAPGFNSEANAFLYEDIDLVSVLIDHSDKVDQLIAFSEKHHDIDPAKLRAHVEGTPIPNTEVKI